MLIPSQDRITIESVLSLDFICGAVPDDLDFEFDPVSEPSDQERADLAKCGTDNIVTAYNAGLISQRTALREMKQQSERTGLWTNITDEDIMKASDEIEPQGEMGGFPGMGDEEDGAGEPDLGQTGRGGEAGDKTKYGSYLRQKSRFFIAQTLSKTV